MHASTTPSTLPWADSPEAIAAIAAGQQQSLEVLHWQASATRLTHPHAGGHTTVHHWAAVQPNGLPPLVLFHGGSGSWTYDVDLARHNTTGTYFIHIYSGNKLVAHTTVTVKSLPNR
jgi:hypothetical protein